MCLLFNIFPLVESGSKIFKKKDDLFFFGVRYLLISFTVVSIWFFNQKPEPLPIVLVSVLGPAVPLIIYASTEKYTHPDYHDSW